MNDYDALRSWLFRSLMFEADSEAFRQAGVRVGVDERSAEESLLEESLAPFPLIVRNEALRMARLYAIIYCFENSVRELIQTRMSEKDQNWWTSQSIPKKVRDTAESRMRDAESNSWLEGVKKEILGFVDFGGLCDIITNNWSDFEDLVPSQHWIKQRFDELERARNFIAHNRMLAPAEFSRLEMYVGDWNRQVGL
jgi:Swt1-like HEPN